MIVSPLLETAVEHLPLFRQGKVRDSYDLGDRLLIVATDRISAFDVIMPGGIPDKGIALTQLSAFWFETTREVISNHMLTTDLNAVDGLLPSERSLFQDRSMVVRKAERVDIECVVRGYISGSAWVEYQRSGTVAGAELPAGLVESQQLQQPIFTPAVKNDSGHDENISVAELRSRVGSELASAIESNSHALYQLAFDYARQRGIIIADTKFEFGFVDGKLIVIDEMLTPDSSRFWDIDAYEPGSAQASFDKQYLRDWLVDSGWNRDPPAPVLPQEIVQGTRNRYLEALERLTGSSFETTTGAGTPRAGMTERAHVS